MILCATTLPAQTLPKYDHIVIVIEENKNDTEIRGNFAQAPYINNVLIPNSADFSAFVAETHPSQPNYLHFFSGSQQGILQDGYPGNPTDGELASSAPPFTTVNLGRELLNAGKTFAIYSESLPPSLPSNRKVAVAANTPGATAYGFTGATYNSPTNPQPQFNQYVHKHNPAANWQRPDASAANNGLPETVNQPFNAFGTTPADFAKLPDVCIVVPDESNDMHDGPISQGDDWLKNNIEPYRQWALTHNSLLIFTFDESDLGELLADPTNQIITLVSGAHIKNGSYTESGIAQFRISDAAAPETAINHYNLLATIETIMGTAHDATAVATAQNPGVTIKPITDIFTDIPPVSRKVHADAGTFDLPLPTTGTIATESRMPGSDNTYQLVFTLDEAVMVLGNAMVTQGAATVVSISTGPQTNQVVVNLATVPNAQTLAITLGGVKGASGSALPTVVARLNVLTGDVGANGTVNAADVAQVKSLSGQTTGMANYRADLNEDGVINAADVALVKSKSGTALP